MERKRNWTVKEIQERAATATAATRWTNAQMNVALNEIDRLHEQVVQQQQQIKILTQLVNPAELDSVTRTALTALGIRLPKEKTPTKRK